MGWNSSISLVENMLDIQMETEVKGKHHQYTMYAYSCKEIA